MGSATDEPPSDSDAPMRRIRAPVKPKDVPVRDRVAATIWHRVVAQRERQSQATSAKKKTLGVRLHP